jgi:hypothetical protein
MARRAGSESKACLTSHLVFIDEMTVSTNTMRLHSRGPHGARVIDDTRGTWMTITFVAAPRHDKMVADR